MYLSGFFLFNILISSVWALYDGNKDIIELNPDNFDSLVINGDDVWMVEYYAPWCGHCQALVAEYIKLASVVKGLIKIGSVNVDVHKSLGRRFEIRGYPTLKIFGMDKTRYRTYNGKRTAHGMVDELFIELRNHVESKLAGRKRDGGSKRQRGNPEDVIPLSDLNFDEIVLGSNDMWLVEFYAPWCGHCQKLAPEWEEAATELKGKMKLGALDATVDTHVARRFSINGFPTIKFFPQGIKDGSAEEYDGGRKAEDIIKWAMDKFAQFAPSPDVLEVTNATVLKTACEDHPLCVISILPHILDCQSNCRNDYLEILKKVGDRFKKYQWSYVWAEAMRQPQLEDALGIGGFGYPAMAVVNVRKMKFSILRGAFSYDGISEFLGTVSVGRGSSSPIKGAKLPDVVETEPWDGKDGQLPVEEDIDLSDVDMDELSDSKKKTEL